MKYFQAFLSLFLALVVTTTGLAIENRTLLERALPPYNPSAPRRGLPYATASWLKNFPSSVTSGSKVSWAYNWASDIDPVFPANLEFVPMLWSDSAGHTGSWDANVKKALARTSTPTTHLLAFNEPDNAGQANMSPKAAAAAYVKWMNPYAGQAYLGAPAISNGGSGVPWLQQFLGNCSALSTPCHIDFIPFHWYDTATNIGYFKNHVADVKAVAGSLNVWITEFRGSGTEAQQETMLKTLLPWMDAQSYISRYAWEWCDPSAKTGALVDSNAKLTPLGITYATT